MSIPPLSYQVRNCVDGSIQVNVNQHLQALLKGRDIEVNAAQINAVGIKDLSQVASHVVNTIVDSRSHVIHFMNGSVLQYAYNKEGQLIELSANNLTCLISSDHELLFFFR